MTRNTQTYTLPVGFVMETPLLPLNIGDEESPIGVSAFYRYWEDWGTFLSVSLPADLYYEAKRGWQLEWRIAVHVQVPDQLPFACVRYTTVRPANTAARTYKLELVDGVLPLVTCPRLYSRLRLSIPVIAWMTQKLHLWSDMIPHGKSGSGFPLSIFC
jgi:hypothetical protein